MPSGSRKLLIIDDDTIVRESVVAYLEDSGFEMLEADQGVVGMALFQQHSPEVVLTDLRMPSMDGLQVLEQVHQLSPETPVIVMSGVGVMGDVVKALRLGASDFLIKPLVDMEVLVHAVEKSLERRDLLAQNLQYRDELEAANSELKDHLRTLQKDQEAGRRVQQQLLPPKKVTKGEYCLEHRIIPSLFLSGDFIDLAYTGDRYFSFYLTDVSGHGASSAFATIWLKHATAEVAHTWQLFTGKRSVAEDMNIGLAEVNRLLLETRLGHHMTCLVGVVDIKLNRLYYAVAGHLPLMVLKTPDQTCFLEGKGRPLGLFPNQEWQLYEAELPPGSAVLAFSDGILEVMPPQDLLEKEDYLLSWLSSGAAGMDNINRTLKLDEIVDAPDDIAVLCLSRSGS
ncbi:response regulator [Aestuariicella hydrocarbonica]|uniref:Response regulator n=1 Tax=Pseudomaricurvus hydrocarbonicus TaxID=1470433 RepID=A0A9E5JUD6_9GAMM|nr:SpoIIE family protein phosphatase [Aestuariicella hydrocarbonica]NHO64721.1 response regulator [Aestuariicella hydrocarbonica]